LEEALDLSFDRLLLMMSNSSWVGGMFYVCFVCTVLAILVNMSIFIFHLWVPKVYVQALVSGSIILAGVVLKLGGYGLLPVFPVLFKFGFRFGIELL